MSTFLNKITVLGDGAVGKTSLCARYMGKGFKRSYLATVGAQVSVKDIDFRGHHFRFQVWDFAGQPSWASLQRPYYLGAFGTILVFDLTRKRTLENLPNWINEQWTQNKSIQPTIVLGNKVDLRKKMPECVSTKEGQAFAKELSEKTKEHGFQVPYIETSAKTGEQVDQAFESLAENILIFRNIIIDE